MIGLGSSRRRLRGQSWQCRRCSPGSRPSPWAASTDGGPVRAAVRCSDRGSISAEGYGGAPCQPIFRAGQGRHEHHHTQAAGEDLELDPAAAKALASPRSSKRPRTRRAADSTPAAHQAITVACRGGTRARGGRSERPHSSAWNPPRTRYSKSAITTSGAGLVRWTSSPSRLLQYSHASRCPDDQRAPAH